MPSDMFPERGKAENAGNASLQGYRNAATQKPDFQLPAIPKRASRDATGIKGCIFGSKQDAAENRHGAWLILWRKSGNRMRNARERKKSPQTLRFAG